MKRLFFFASTLLFAFALRAAEAETDAPGLGKVRLECAKPSGWRFSLSTEALSDGVSVVTVRGACDVESRPPEFKVAFKAPGAGANHVWSAYDDRYMLYPTGWDRSGRYVSQLAYRTPVVSAFCDDGRNILSVSCSEAFRRLCTKLAISESTCELEGFVRFFTEYEPPRKDCVAKIRFDVGQGNWAKAVTAASSWVSAVNGFKPCRVPESAYDPLYSSWYAFWQDVHAPVMEREMALAYPLGMRTAILDDGWQKAESASFYSKTGDWLPVKDRFPDMRAHVDAVHKTGMRYMLWFAVPYCGDETEAWNRFQGKFLRIDGEKSPGRVGILDPRFPEVREYLISIYERGVRDWDLDGLKLDFVDQFRIEGVDPAERENFAGRDYRSVPEAADRLMRDVVQRLQKIKPDVLLEFRQQYMGPAILQYGNMIRATDCPADSDKIRKLTADLRLTSGPIAVHSDMLVWNREEPPELAARPILNSLFSVVQYSMVLDGLPESHRKVIRHWIDFTQKHRAALLKGEFKPYHPELLYPRLEAENADEKIVALYSVPQYLDLGMAEKPVCIVNATFSPEIPVRIGRPAKVCSFDVFGNRMGMARIDCGMHALKVPVSGHVEIRAD